RLNLTWIESFPIAGSKNEYLFFVEMEGHRDEAKVKRALDALKRKTVQLSLLGSYQRGSLVE
ncbi:MAG: prephenate dehydratase, partial [Planctomycetales bacterium]|nr:prephenate dehydratase [Planctomycetales bacterium]